MLLRDGVRLATEGICSSALSLTTLSCWYVECYIHSVCYILRDGVRRATGTFPLPHTLSHYVVMLVCKCYIHSVSCVLRGMVE